MLPRRIRYALWIMGGLIVVHVPVIVFVHYYLNYIFLCYNSNKRCELILPQQLHDWIAHSLNAYLSIPLSLLPRPSGGGPKFVHLPGTTELIAQLLFFITLSIMVSFFVGLLLDMMKKREAIQIAVDAPH